MEPGSMDGQEAYFIVWVKRKQKYDLVFSDMLFLGDKQKRLQGTSEIV